jgi:hypothetical protein
MEIKLACLSQSLQDHISDLIDKYWQSKWMICSLDEIISVEKTNKSIIIYNITTIT